MIPWSDCASRLLVKAPLNRLKGRFPLEEVQIEARGDWLLLVDDEAFEFFGLDTVSWLKLARGDELIYACCEERSTEFLHIRDGVCLREYRNYDGETHDNRGTDPDTGVKNRLDIERYMDKYMT